MVGGISVQLLPQVRTHRGSRQKPGSDSGWCCLVHVPSAHLPRRTRRLFAGEPRAPREGLALGPGEKPRALRTRAALRRGKYMRTFSISSDGNLAITASEASSKNDFDYLVGNWSIRNRTLKEQLTGSDEWN